MSIDQPRQPKGRPTGGEFAATDRAESGVSLAYSPADFGFEENVRQFRALVEAEARDAITAYFHDHDTTLAAAFLEPWDNDDRVPELAHVVDANGEQVYDMSEHSDLRVQVFDIVSNHPDFRDDEVFSIDLYQPTPERRIELANKRLMAANVGMNEAINAAIAHQLSGAFPTPAAELACTFDSSTGTLQPFEIRDVDGTTLAAVHRSGEAYLFDGLRPLLTDYKDVNTLRRDVEDRDDDDSQVVFHIRFGRTSA